MVYDATQRVGVGVFVIPCCYAGQVQVMPGYVDRTRDLLRSVGSLIGSDDVNTMSQVL